MHESQEPTEGNTTELKDREVKCCGVIVATPFCPACGAALLDNFDAPEALLHHISKTIRGFQGRYDNLYRRKGQCKNQQRAEKMLCTMTRSIEKWCKWHDWISAQLKKDTGK